MPRDPLQELKELSEKFKELSENFKYDSPASSSLSSYSDDGLRVWSEGKSSAFSVASEMILDFMKNAEVKPHRSKWETDLVGLVSLLESNKGKAWWGRNAKLKYLELRVDIRDCAFTISDRYGQPATAEEVCKAVGTSWKSK